MPSAPIVPWWQAMGLRAEIAASGGADDVRMSLHDAVYGRKGTDTPVAYAAPADYAAITHPSPSLLDLMARIAIRLAGPPSAAPAAVWHLGQAMGGGKSHGLVGLWHLATNPQQLAATPLGQSVARAVTDMVGVGKVAEDLDNPMCVVLIGLERFTNYQVKAPNVVCYRFISLSSSHTVNTVRCYRAAWRQT